MNTIDLHTHTCYSDGKDTPSELLLKAAQAGLKTIAITDHDNARGARLALPLAQGMGIELIPGMEVTTSWRGLALSPGLTDVDLLGYFVDFESPAFKALERELTEDITRRIEDLCACLGRAGLPLTMADMLATNPYFPSTTAVIHTLQANGVAASFDSGARIVMDGWAKVSPAKIEIRETIQRLHAAGGAAVLAHPGATWRAGGMIDEKQASELAEMGLDGIEVYHHRNDEKTRRWLLSLAGNFDFAVTGGSDEHGWHQNRLGSQPVTGEMVEVLRARTNHRTGSPPSSRKGGRSFGHALLPELKR